MNFAAKCGLCVGRAFINDRSLNIIRQQIARTCGAIIIEIIVAIHPVLGQIVGINSHGYAAFIGRREVEHLLNHPPMLALILFHKGIKGNDAHFIIGESEDKTQNKILLCE